MALVVFGASVLYVLYRKWRACYGKLLFKIRAFRPDVGHIAQSVEHRTQLYRFWSGSNLIVDTKQIVLMHLMKMQMHESLVCPEVLGSNPNVAIFL